MRRVVVTGMGIACPLGVGVEHVWRRLINAESGIGAITAFDAKDLPCKVAGQVPAGVKETGGLDINEWIPVKDQKKMDRFIHLAMVAGTEAVEDSGWVPETEDDHCATGVMIGSGIGGLDTIYNASILVYEGKARRLSPFFIPSALGNLASGHLSIKYGFKGPNHSVGDRVRHGRARDRRCRAPDHAGRRRRDAGRRVGSDGVRDWASPDSVHRARCPPASMTDPAAASRPWDKDRDGFVMGEGSGCVVLEEYEHAQEARREDLCRGIGLRHVRRRLSHHRAGRGP